MLENEFRVSDKNTFMIESRLNEVSPFDFIEAFNKKYTGADLPSQSIVENLVAELSISLNGKNMDGVKGILKNLSTLKEIKNIAYTLQNILKDFIGFTNFIELDKQENTTLSKILRKKVELEYGYMTYLKLSNVVVLLKYAEKILQKNENSLKDSIEKRNADRALRFNYQPHEAEGVHGKEIMSNYYKIQSNFGVHDLCVPYYMHGSHLKEWTKDLHSDLQIFADFLKIPPHLMCNFKMVLGHQSRYGQSSFNVIENTVFLDDTNTFPFVHEWFHYLDYHVGTYIGQLLKKYDLIINEEFWSAINFIPEMEEIEGFGLFSLAEFLRAFMLNTEFYKNATNMDKQDTGKRYWSASHEMFARTFEIWVHYHLKNKLKVIIDPRLDKNQSLYPSGNLQGMIVTYWDNNWHLIKDAYINRLSFKL